MVRAEAASEDDGPTYHSGVECAREAWAQAVKNEMHSALEHSDLEGTPRSSFCAWT